MIAWRKAILEEFVLGVSKLTLVADPDNLLTEEKLALELRGRGFDLIEFIDPIEFRYAYESKYRSIWDQGKHTDLVVILRMQDTALDLLPYDLLQAGRKLSFNLGDLFPELSYPVIANLDRSLLDTLFEAQEKFPPDRMGDNATKDYILRHVFGIAPELIAGDVQLLRALLRLHYGNLQIPLILAKRLIQVLKDHEEFKAWPLDEIVVDSQAFFAFLQERWPVFLNRLSSAPQVRENSLQHDLKYPGPDHLPFDHQDIKVYIDNLFLEGKLNPVQVTYMQVDAQSWIRAGVAKAAQDDEEIRIKRLFDIVEKELPGGKSRSSDWTAYAFKWAELCALVNCAQDFEHESRIKEIGDNINATFTRWLETHFASLINLPPTIPAMVHHVPRRLARDLEDSHHSHAALIVVDGLALEQWVSIRQVLYNQDPRLVMRESAIFAWLPTLTSVSRQSIFAGKPPLYFPSSINSTNNEAKLWKQFWEGCGVSRLDVFYQRGLGEGDAATVVDSVGSAKVLGLVINTVDNIMHGMQLGAAGMHNQIRQWCQRGFLAALIGNLLDSGHEVWLTSDHGNIECKGKGRPSEGVIAETQGERVRVYPTPELRSQIAHKFSWTTEWQPAGLPPDYFPLFAGGRDAFVNPGHTIVGHGGLSIEEVIVPFVKCEREAR